MKKIVHVAGLLAVALASAVASAAGFSEYAPIQSIEVDGVTTGNSETYLYFTTLPSQNKPACATAGVLMIGSTDSVKSMTSIATAAFLAGRTVRMYWDGACISTYGKITAIQMN